MKFVLNRTHYGLVVPLKYKVKSGLNYSLAPQPQRKPMSHIEALKIKLADTP